MERAFSIYDLIVTVGYNAYFFVTQRRGWGDNIKKIFCVGLNIVFFYIFVNDK